MFDIEDLNSFLADKEKYPQAIQLLRQMVEAGQYSDWAYANICILYDRLGDSANLKHYLKTPSNLSSTNFDVWFSFGCLHLKLSFFKEAIRCFKEALKLESGNPHVLLRLGYCYEGLRRFKLAIKVAEKALDIALNQPVGTLLCNFTNRLYVIQQFECINHEHQERGLLAELCHALGHFYIGRCHSGKNGEVLLEDRDAADDYMRQAVKLNNDYFSCYGNIHSETKRYYDAIEIFNQVIKDPIVRNKHELYNELIFYRGVAFLGMEKYQEALTDFQRIETFATNILIEPTKDIPDYVPRDILANAKFYQIKTYIKQKSLEELTIEEFQSYIETLEKYQPSAYVPIEVRISHNKLLNVLKGLHLLKFYLHIESENDIMLGQIISHLEDVIDCGEKLSYLVIGEKDETLQTFFQSKVRVNYLEPCWLDARMGELSEEQFSLLEKYPVWLVLLQLNKISAPSLAAIAFSIGKYMTEKTIIIWSDQCSVPLFIDGNSDQLLITDSLDNALFVTHFTLLHDEARKYIGMVDIPLGLAPISIAPALVSQTRQLDPLEPLEGMKKHE